MTGLVARIGLDSSRFDQGVKAVVSTATTSAAQIAARYAAAASGTLYIRALINLIEK